MEIDYKKLADEFVNTDISLTQLAKRENIGRWTLTDRFKKLGVVIINKQNISKFNEHIFDCIDTEEKAYWLGFLFADGYICNVTEESKKRYLLEISLAICDVNHLYKFATFLQHKNPHITISDTNYGGKRCRFNVANKHLWETLKSYGCVPNKSLILKFPEITIFKSPELIRHFMRGYFDGDGCISRSINKTTVVLRMELIGTIDFLKQWDTFAVVKGVYSHDKRHSENTFSLWYHKEDTTKILNFLYNNCNIYLDRKYKLYQFFKSGSRSVQEWIELSSGNIGEGLNIDNTEITLENNNSKVSYSIENETEKNIISPRVSDTPTEISG